MHRTRFIEHGGRRILLLDYSGLGASLEELQAEIAATKEIVGREKPGSVLTAGRRARPSPRPGR